MIIFLDCTRTQEREEVVGVDRICVRFNKIYCSYMLAVQNGFISKVV
jgi:hypothetical protein